MATYRDTMQLLKKDGEYTDMESLLQSKRTKMKPQFSTVSCPTLCDPMDYTVRGFLQARILEWVAFPLFQGIFPTQGSNPGLLHCRWTLYQLSHKGSPVQWLEMWILDLWQLHAYLTFMHLSKPQFPHFEK